MGNRPQMPKGVQEAFHRVVHDHDVPTLAARLGISPGTLYNKANLNDNESNHNKPTLADAVVVTNLTGDKRIAQAFCASVGGVYHELPDLSGLTTDALMQHILQIEAKGGDFYREIHDALANDDAIDGREFARIEKRAHVWLSAILAGLARMQEMSGSDR